jgi:hypothetical protein
MTDARIAEARARCIRGTDAESQPDEDAPITSAMGKLVEAGVLSPHTAASYIEDLECLLTHIRADLPAALDDLAELRERVRLLEAVAEAADAAWEDYDGEETWSIPEDMRQLKATLAAAGYGNKLAEIDQVEEASDGPRGTE